MLLRRTLPLLLILPLLAGCIIVRDFGEIWSKASGDICLNRINAALYYQVYESEFPEDKITDVARGITLGNDHYILMKKSPEDTGGFLFRFTVKGGIFTRYRLNPAARKLFEQEYPDAPVKLRENTVTLAEFNDATLTLLDKIAGDKRFWETEDKTLYNTQLNPFCRFEDRDLKKMER
ncbi:MAG: hypothetical protein ACK529_02595 [Alphaproteobacteria bacterium]